MGKFQRYFWSVWRTKEVKRMESTYRTAALDDGCGESTREIVGQVGQKMRRQTTNGDDGRQLLT